MALAIVFVVGLSAVFTVDKASNFGNVVYKEYADYVLQHSEPLDNTVLSDGIRLRLLSAYKDQESIALFFSVTDEESDRLSEATGCNVDVNYAFSSGSQQFIEYDKESKTVTFLLEYDFSSSEIMDEEITFSLSHLYTGRRGLPWEPYQQEGLDPYQIVKDHTAEIKKTTFYDQYDSFHLKGSQLNIPLEGFSENWVHFSNAGFIDGKFHLQVANKNGTEAARAQANVYTLYLIDKNGNKLGEGATGRLPDETDEIRVLSFYENGWTFREFIFPEISDVDDLMGMKVVAEGENYDYMSDGIWQTTFRLPDNENNVTIPVAKEIILGKRKVNAHKITISPLYMRVYHDGFYWSDSYSAFSDYELPGQTYPEDEVFITYKDGTKVVLDWREFVNDSTGAGYLAVEKFSLSLTDSLEVIELKKVKSITIYEQEFLLVSQ